MVHITCSLWGSESVKYSTMIIIVQVHNFELTVSICMQVLLIVGSPYSVDFGSAFLPLVQNQEITAPLTNTDMTDPVSLFLGIIMIDIHV